MGVSELLFTWNSLSFCAIDNLTCRQMYNTRECVIDLETFRAADRQSCINATSSRFWREVKVIPHA